MKLIDSCAFGHETYILKKQEISKWLILNRAEILGFLEGEGPFCHLPSYDCQGTLPWLRQSRAPSLFAAWNRQGGPPGPEETWVLSEFTHGWWLLSSKETMKHTIRPEDHGLVNIAGFEPYGMTEHTHDCGKDHLHQESRWACKKRLFGMREGIQPKRTSGCGPLGASGINSQQILIYGLSSLILPPLTQMTATGWESKTDNLFLST